MAGRVHFLFLLYFIILLADSKKNQAALILLQLGFKNRGISRIRPIFPIVYRIENTTSQIIIKFNACIV
jgi:hypothetical protein